MAITNRLYLTIYYPCRILFYILIFPFLYWPIQIAIVLAGSSVLKTEVISFRKITAHSLRGEADKFTDIDMNMLIEKARGKVLLLGKTFWGGEGGYALGGKIMDPKLHKHTFTALVANKSGVLARVSGLFSRRGFNIDSLAVGDHVARATRGQPLTLARPGTIQVSRAGQVVEPLDELPLLVLHEDYSAIDKAGHVAPTPAPSQPHQGLGIGANDSGVDVAKGVYLGRAQDPKHLPALATILHAGKRISQAAVAGRAERHSRVGHR